MSENDTEDMNQTNVSIETDSGKSSEQGDFVFVVNGLPKDDEQEQVVEVSASADAENVTVEASVQEDEEPAPEAKQEEPATAAEEPAPESQPEESAQTAQAEEAAKSAPAGENAEAEKAAAPEAPVEKEAPKAKKRSKKGEDGATPRAAIEFQPDALEIKNSKLPLAIRLCVWMPFLVILGAIIWASISEVDVVVSARGKVITNQPTIVMKPYNRVVVKSVNVKVGDTVEKDQVLIVFDPEIYVADRDRLENDVETATAQYARFQAEFFNRDYVIPADPSKYEKEQRAIFEQRKNYFSARVKSSDSSIQYYEDAEQTKKVSLESMKAQLVHIKKLCAQYESLEKNQAVSWREYTQMVISRLEMEGNIATAEQGLQELRSQRESAKESKEAFIQEWRKSISEDMVATQSRLKTAQSQLKQTEQLCEYTELRAPCRAVVHELASFAEKSGVREAEPLITLIPIDDVMIEAEVRPMDIGKVHKGSDARIKLDAYPFQKYDTLDGMVIDISENTIQKDQRSMDPEASMTYYRTRLAYFGKLKGVPDSFRLIPGMEAQVEIKVGRRKVITYVLYPLIKALDTAAREP